MKHGGTDKNTDKLKPSSPPVIDKSDRALNDGRSSESLASAERIRCFRLVAA
jgi:hypothetical protein